jgi:hypothetical protein
MLSRVEWPTPSEAQQLEQLKGQPTYVACVEQRCNKMDKYTGNATNVEFNICYMHWDCHYMPDRAVSCAQSKCQMACLVQRNPSETWWCPEHYPTHAQEPGSCQMPDAFKLWDYW